ncbi:MAG: zf-HC2 domain-containing protein [Gammaproteobacteria bacterium]|nr:zf-HC2 domain-containing protein [Gammaproteobacteria bacterium]
MQCVQIHTMLDDYLDDSLSALHRESIDRHLEGCQPCRQQVLFAQVVQHQLSAMPYPAPSAGFELRALQKIGVAPSKYRLRYVFAAGFTSALAASVALWLVFAPGPVPGPTSSRGVADVELVTDQTQQINLVFNSPAEIDNATLRLELPRNIELVGYPTQQRLEWQTSLRKGTNRLQLPLIARGRTDGPILASIISNGKKKTFNLNVVTKALPFTATSQLMLPVVLT